MQKHDFRNWQINRDINCLEDGQGKELFIQPRLIKFLSVLVENQNKVVTKDQLINSIWDGVVVGDESITKAAFDLRKFLLENFHNPPELESIRSVGYRLHMPANKSPTKRVIKILKVVGYVILCWILLILIIRGINY